MGYKTELHCHSKEFSWCAGHAAKDIVEEYKACGYTTIVLTNHLMSRYLVEVYPGLSYEQLVRRHFEAVEIMRECAGDSMNIIAGTELRFSQNINDYLVYGMDEEAFLSLPDVFDMGINRFCDEAHERGALVIQAHPFRPDMTITGYKHIDGIEVYNGSHRNPLYNKQALFLAENWTEKKLIRTSGSDHHNADQTPAGGIITDTPITCTAELLRYLRSGDYTLVCD